MLVLGASGGVGSLAVQVARSRPARLLGPQAGRSIAHPAFGRQITKHHLRCHVVASCSAPNAARVKAPARPRGRAVAPERSKRRACDGTGQTAARVTGLVKPRQALGADEVVDYNRDGWLARVRRPELGAGREGFSMVLDCVGGDDDWEQVRSRNLMVT